MATKYDAMAINDGSGGMQVAQRQLVQQVVLNSDIQEDNVKIAQSVTNDGEVNFDTLGCAITLAAGDTDSAEIMTRVPCVVPRQAIATYQHSCLLSNSADAAVTAVAGIRTWDGANLFAFALYQGGVTIRVVTTSGVDAYITNSNWNVNSLHLSIDATALNTFIIRAVWAEQWVEFGMRYQGRYVALHRYQGDEPLCDTYSFSMYQALSVSGGDETVALFTGFECYQNYTESIERSLLGVVRSSFVYPLASRDGDFYVIFRMQGGAHSRQIALETVTAISLTDSLIMGVEFMLMLDSDGTFTDGTWGNMDAPRSILEVNSTATSVSESGAITTLVDQMTTTLMYTKMAPEVTGFGKAFSLRDYLIVKFSNSAAMNYRVVFNFLEFL